MDRGAWRAAVHGVVKSRTRLSSYQQQYRLRAMWNSAVTVRGMPSCDCEKSTLFPSKPAFLRG